MFNCLGSNPIIADFMHREFHLLIWGIMKGNWDFLVSTFLKGHVIDAGRLSRPGPEEVFSRGSHTRRGTGETRLAVKWGDVYLQFQAWNHCENILEVGYKWTCCFTKASNISHRNLCTEQLPQSKVLNSKFLHSSDMIRRSLGMGCGGGRD